MNTIYFGDFRIVVINLIKDIDTTNPEPQSIEWFLLKYLKRIAKHTESADRPGQVESAMRGLVRFYVDNINEKSELGYQCIHIYEQYRKVLREKQSGDHSQQ